MTPASPQQQSGPSKVAGWVVGLIAGLVAFYLVQRATSGGFGRPDWKSETVARVTLDAPCRFSPSKEAFPQQLRDLTESIEAHEGKVGRDSFRLGVMRIQYKPGLPLNIGGAIDGSIRGGAQKLGDPNPRFTTETTTVSGLDARRGRYETTYNGRPARLDALVVQKGSTMWMVLCTSDGQKVRPGDIDRIFGSVKIAQ